MTAAREAVFAMQLDLGIWDPASTHCRFADLTLEAKPEVSPKEGRAHWHTAHYTFTAELHRFNDGTVWVDHGAEWARAAKFIAVETELVGFSQGR